MELDILDRKILHQLDFDSRQSAKEIAKRIGSNKDTVNFRIKRLEREKIITGYLARVNTAKFGLTSIKTYIKFQDIDEKKEQEFFDYLQGIPEVGWAAQTSGSWDALFSVWTQSSFSYYAFLMKILNKFSKNIYEKEIIHNMHEVYYNHKWMLPESNKINAVRYGGEPALDRLNDTDIAVLKELVKNGRGKFSEIAERTGISPQNVFHHVKILKKKGVITQFGIDLNYEKLGIVYTKTMIRLHNVDEKSLASIQRFCEREPRVFAFITTLGAWDLELEMEVTRVEEMMDMMNRIKRAFPDFIKDYDSIIITKQPKTSYIPIPWWKPKKQEF
jgi:Lrp/AsnC family leucine-responsive transcriptional regulator